MFKSALSAITSTVVGAAKNTIDNYHPANLIKEGGAFSRIAQQGIANIAYRSPILADIAQTLLHTIQLDSANKERLKAYTKSDSASDFRAAVTKKLGDQGTPKKIDAEMVKILDKIEKSIVRDGIEKTKTTSIFKEFGKYTPQSTTAPTSASASEQSSGDITDGVAHASLNKIESNTQRTVNVLEEIATRGVMGRGASGSDGGVASGGTHSLSGSDGGVASGGTHSFIDPMTGMPSISAAVGSIGGSFLAKVFDEDTIEKFVKKTKKLFGFENEESEPVSDISKKPTRPKKSDIPKAFKDILENLSLDLNDSKDKVNVFTTNSSGVTTTGESVKDNVVSATDNQSSELLKVQTDNLNELKKLNKTSEKNVEIVKKTDKKDDTEKKIDIIEKTKSKVMDGIKARMPGIDTELPYKIGNTVGKGINYANDGVSTLLGKGGRASSYLPKVASKASKIATSNLGSTVGGVAEVAGTVGKVGAATEVAGGIAEVAGIIGRVGLMALAAPAIAAAAPFVAGAAAVGAIGYGASKLIAGGDDNKSPIDAKGIEKAASAAGITASEIRKNINPSYTEKQSYEVSSAVQKSPIDDIQSVKSTNSTQLINLNDAKEKQKETSSKSAAPIIVNNNTTSSGGNSSPSIISGGMSVRNTESTFERVQMQDFWKRSV